MKKSKTLALTTGQVANYLGVTRLTIKKLIRNGSIKAIKLPVSGHERVYPHKLMEFITKNELLVPPELLTICKMNNPTDDLNPCDTIDMAVQQTYKKYSSIQQGVAALCTWHAINLIKDIELEPSFGYIVTKLLAMYGIKIDKLQRTE